MGEATMKVKDRRKNKYDKHEVKRKQDEFLDVYSLYLATGLPWVKEEVIAKAYELHTLDQSFSIEI